MTFDAKDTLIFTSTPNISYECDACEDSGYVFDMETRQLMPCHCAAQRRAAELERWKAQQRLELRKTISQRIDLDKTRLPGFPLPQGGAWLYGRAGAGKTHLAAYMLMRFIELAREKVSWCFHPVRALLDAWVRQYSDDGEMRSQAIGFLSRLASCRVVVIDDIDKISRITPAREEGFYTLFDTLHSRGATLVVTSQVSIDDFCKRMPSEAEYMKRDGVGPQQRRLRELCREVRL
ncbi:MAG: ATP-binding protein [candidate division KSB1 bacterium]|nr:ATP-binding protein [candidate division KSB1 bacterium]